MSSAAVVIGALRVKNYLQVPEFRTVNMPFPFYSSILVTLFKFISEPIQYISKNKIFDWYLLLSESVALMVWLFILEFRYADTVFLRL